MDCNFLNFGACYAIRYKLLFQFSPYRRNRIEAVPWQTPERQTPERQTPVIQTPERQTPERQTPDETNSWKTNSWNYEIFLWMKFDKIHKL